MKMRIRGFFLCEIGLLLVLQFMLTSSVFARSLEEESLESSESSEDSRIFPFFSNLHNKTNQFFDSLPNKTFPFFFNRGGDRKSRQLPCPQTPSCQNWANNRYRSPNGVCNNLQNPLWGSAGIPFIRYLPSDYDDGISVPRGDGLKNLRTPREVSVAVSSAGNPGPTQPVSLMVMQWGQFIDHDLVLTPEFEDEHCCEEGIASQSTHPECRELNVTGDAFYSQFGVECLHFVRSEFADQSCVQGQAREQVNALTAYLDGSQVYGSSQQEQNDLRTFTNGQLKIGPGEEIFTGSCPAICPFTFLPRRTNSDGEEELFAGDGRVQEQPGLTSLHTLFVRAHNDLALQLSLKYSSFTDESIFQETRRIVSAMIQHITYEEFLPVVLGSDSMNQHVLYPRFNGYTNYLPQVSASAANVFATAAFRFGHSLIRDSFVLDTNVVALHESFNNLGLTTTQGRYPSDFLRGIISAQADGMDHFMVQSVTNLLFAEGPSFLNGSDLLARNIMRGRDHGIPPYNAWRELCQLPLVTAGNIENFMSQEAADAIASVYSDPDLIDLFPAAIAEFPADPGDGILGPTFTCIIGKYFHDLKYGDRYYYETNDQPVPFDSDQLEVIRQTYLSSLICAYTNTQQIRRFAMLLNVPGNPIRSCQNILQQTVPDLITVVF